MEKLVIVVISLNLLTESLDRKHVTCICLYQRYVDILYNRVISVENEFISEERFVLELPTSRAMLATARPLVDICPHADGQSC